MGLCYRKKLNKLQAEASRKRSAYASEEYWQPVREQIRLMDHLGASAKGNEKRLMCSHFLLSSRYEFLFWDQAYRLEEWPV